MTRTRLLEDEVAGVTRWLKGSPLGKGLVATTLLLGAAGATSSNATPCEMASATCEMPDVPMATPATKSRTLTHWHEREMLATAYRALAARGLNAGSGLGSHLTMSVGPNFTDFLVVRYGLHWYEVSAENLLLVDPDGNILEGEGPVQVGPTPIHLSSTLPLSPPAPCAGRGGRAARPGAHCEARGRARHLPHAPAVVHRARMHQVWRAAHVPPRGLDLQGPHRLRPGVRGQLAQGEQGRRQGRDEGGRSAARQPAPARQDRQLPR